MAHTHSNHLKRLLHERAQFAIGSTHENVGQRGYAEACLNKAPTTVRLVFHSNFFNAPRREEREVQSELLNGWHLNRLAEIGNIWSGVAEIPFVLVEYGRRPESVFRFARFEPPGKVLKSRNGVIEELGFDDELLAEIADWLDGKQAQTGFDIDRSALDTQRLSYDFHDPSLRQMETDVRRKPHWVLREVAEILKPRLLQEEGRVLQPGSWVYPFDPSQLPVKRRSNVEVRKGDLLVLQDGKTFFLNPIEFSEPVFASQFSYVIRTKGIVSSEYLFLFLQSDARHEYATAHGRGSVLVRVNKSDLENMPVPKPDPAVLERSIELFERLFLKKTVEDPESLRSLLFDTKETGASNIDAKFLLEQLSNIEDWKKNLLRDIIADDLKEIEACFSNDALKATAVLCGSVLEAVLLDWLSEVEGKNLVTSGRPPKLHSIINQLHEASILLERERDAAH